MNSIICELYRQMCLYMCVMEDQREALAVTTRLTDTVYLVRPTGIQTVNPWISKQQPSASNNFNHFFLPKFKVQFYLSKLPWIKILIQQNVSKIEIYLQIQLIQNSIIFSRISLYPTKQACLIYGPQLFLIEILSINQQAFYASGLHLQ